MTGKPRRRETSQRRILRIVRIVGAGANASAISSHNGMRQMKHASQLGKTFQEEFPSTVRNARNGSSQDQYQSLGAPMIAGMANPDHI